MKTRLIFLVLLIVCFACGTNNKPVSDAQKEKIKGEVKAVVDTIIRGVEEANFNLAIRPWLDSPDFIYINNGKEYTYKEVIDGFGSMFNTLQSQKGTIVDEKFAVLDNSTVLYTTNSKWLMNFKDGHAVLQDPWIVQFIFKKTDSKWRAISGVESGFEKVVKASETLKELNQVELMKQFLGKWSGEMGKDTTYSGEIKMYGTGMLSDIKTATKGKTIMEGHTIIGYDSKTDKYTETDLVKGYDVTIYSLWFDSKTTCIEVPYQYALYPENAPVIWKYEFKPPDIMVWNFISNNKTIGSYTFHRGK